MIKTILELRYYYFVGGLFKMRQTLIEVHLLVKIRIFGSLHYRNITSYVGPNLRWFFFVSYLYWFIFSYYIQPNNYILENVKSVFRILVNELKNVNFRKNYIYYFTISWLVFSRYFFYETMHLGTYYYDPYFSILFRLNYIFGR
jgi:hypothetical protein